MLAWWSVARVTVEHAEPFLEELPQPADEAGERVGREQHGGKLGNADLLPSLPNGDGAGAGVVAERLQQESVSTIQAWRAGTAHPRGRFRSVALEHVLAPLLGVKQRHADYRALPGQAWWAPQGGMALSIRGAEGGHQRLVCGVLHLAILPALEARVAHCVITDDHLAATSHLARKAAEKGQQSSVLRVVRLRHSSARGSSREGRRRASRGRGLAL